MTPFPSDLESFARVAAAIHTHGHLVQIVGTGECSVPGCDGPPSPRPWAYTVGLCQADHPELLTFGLGTCHAGPLLNWVADQHRAGNTLPIGRDHRLQFQGVQIRLVPVPERCIDPTQDLMAQWHGYYSAFGPYACPQVVQVVHADARSRFPWHADYDQRSRFAQPVLEDDPLALRRQHSPIGPSRRTHAAKPRQRRR